MLKILFSLILGIFTIVFMPFLKTDFFMTFAYTPETSQNNTNEKKPYTISPSSGLPGKKYDVIVTVPNCDKSNPSAKKPKLIAPQGSDVTVVVDEEKSSVCFIVATLSIADNARFGKISLFIENESNSGKVDFEIIAVAPGPIPPGIDPQVDIMWSVLPRELVRDNFGRRISDKYYCIQIAIGNNSGYSLQIANVGFKLPGASNNMPKIPSSSYQMVRGSLERTQEVGGRNLLITGLKAFGPIATGFIPFFRSETNTNPRLNFTQGVAIFSGPFTQLLELVIPDTTVRQLVRLDTQTLRNGLIVSNNTQLLTLVFFPKDFFPLIKNDSSEDVKKYGMTEQDRANPQKVMEKLGSLVLIGDQIEYKNRVQVTSDSQNKGVTPPPSINAGQQVSITEGDDKERDIVISGNFLDKATIVYPETKMQITDIKADPNGKSISAKLKVNKDTPAGNYPLVISTEGGAANYPLVVSPKPPDITTQTVQEPVEKPEIFGNPINIIPKTVTVKPEQKAVKFLLSGTDIHKAEVLFKEGSPGEATTTAIEKNGKNLLRVIIVISKDAKGDFPITVRLNSVNTDITLRLPNNIAQSESSTSE